MYPMILPTNLPALHYSLMKPWLPRSPQPPSSLPMQDTLDSLFFSLQKVVLDVNVT